MDRRLALKHAGIAGVLAAGVAPAVQAQQVLRFRLASSFPKSLDTLFGGTEVFAAKVKEMSGGKIEITVKNEDSTADEFDSRDLKREKVIAGGKEGVVIVGPLQPGEYHFQGEYHAKTAQGVLIVK